MNHCLETGGKHVEPAHFRLMMACAEICRTSAHFMLINTPRHKHTCKECAQICAECASDCERIGGIEECVGDVPGLRGIVPQDGGLTGGRRQ